MWCKISGKPQLVTTREKVELLLNVKNLSLGKLANAIGERKQTIAYRLDKPDASQDETFWPRMAAELGVSAKTLLDEAEELPEWAMTNNVRASRLPVGGNLLDMLFEILEDPEESPERKKTARETIRLWLRDFLH